MEDRGKIIAGKYELVEPAGKGGMATVWHALQRGPAGFARPVGLKRIRPELVGDGQFVALFVEEARVSAQLVHPNIVQVYDFGHDDEGCYFIVMEWIEGLSLAQYLVAQRKVGLLPPWHLVAAVGIEALRGLDAAHSRVDAMGNPAPVYHRDVTPQNILMGVNGIVKLTDFGLARAMDRARMTGPDIIKGKVGYLAPELTQGHEPSPQSDIYAMGVVLWQALAGRALFPGDNDVDIFVQASRGEIPPLSEVRPDVPPPFTSIVERALARDPDDRFRSAEQMGRVIANLLRTVPQRPDAGFLSESVVEVREQLGLPSAPPSRVGR